MTQFPVRRASPQAEAEKITKSLGSPGRSPHPLKIIPALAPTISICAYSAGRMKPVDLQQIGDELAIKWEDGAESFVKLEKLRRNCPCAGCKGETDVMGNVYKLPDKPLPASAFHLVRISTVGGYAVQPQWADGHSSGLFSFDYLRSVADSA